MLVLVATVMMLAAQPPAQTGDGAAALLARGEQLLVDLEYDEAASTLMRAAAAPDATLEQRVRAHMLAGIANRVVGRDAEARINFRNVLLAAPGMQLPEGTSPKVASFFEAVRQEVALEQVAAMNARRDASAAAKESADATEADEAAQPRERESEAEAQRGAEKNALPMPDEPSRRAGMWPWVLAGTGGVVAVGSAGLASATFVYANGKRDDVGRALDAYRLDASTANRSTLVRTVRESEAAAGQHNCLLVSVGCFFVPAGLAGILGGVTWGVYDGAAE